MLAVAGALCGTLAVPVTVISTSSAGSAAVSMRHYTPSNATLAGVGWSVLIGPGGGGGGGSTSGTGGPHPNGVGWS